MYIYIYTYTYVYIYISTCMKRKYYMHKMNYTNLYVYYEHSQQ